MVISLRNLKYVLISIILLILISNESTLFSDIFNLISSLVIGFIDFKLKDKLGIVWPIISVLFLLAILLRIFT